jgi:alkaline phosphatase D
MPPVCRRCRSASGDPKPSSVVLWTRVLDPLNPTNSSDLTVQLDVATDPNFASIVQQRTNLLARDAFDHCVKTRLEGLSANTFYYYRFGFNGTWSHVGRTKTAPAPEQAVPQRFAYLNCQDYIGRNYNTLAHLVQNESNRLDFVVHLGDYIYETTGDPSFQATGAVRSITFNDTNGAIRLGSAFTPYYAASSLDNYRQLYRTYRSDASLQRVHELFPMVAIWDVGLSPR